MRPTATTGLRRHLGDLGDQRLGRLDGVAVGAPVDARQHGAGGGVEQRGLGAGGAEVEAEHGRRACVAGVAAGERGRAEAHDRAGPSSAGSRRPMRLRTGRTSASGSAGKTGRRAAAVAGRPGGGRRRPRAGGREAQRARAPRTRRPASATSTGASLSAATPAAIGAMSAPWPTSTTGPSILLLSYRLWTLRATPSNSPRKMRPCDSPWLAKCVSSLLANTAQRLVTVTPSGLASARATASSSERPRRAQRPSTVSPVPAEQRSLAS